MFGDVLTGLSAVDARTVAWRLNFADAVLAYVSVGPGAPEHRRLVTAVASGILKADAAVEMTADRYAVLIDREYRPRIGDFDDYMIDGTLTLKNNLRDAVTGDEVIDPVRFRAIEVEISRIRLVELAKKPITGDFDADHYRAVHRELFRDIYPWAGQFRLGPDTPMIRFAPDSVNYPPGDPNAPPVKYTYYSGPDMIDASSVQFAQLSEILRSRDVSREVLLDRVAESLGEFNSIHPFRDGNARAFCAFGAHFGQQIGYLPDYAEVVAESAQWAGLVHAQLNYQATDEHALLAQSLLAVNPVAVRPQPASAGPVGLR